MIVDIEKLTSKYLRADPDIIAIGTRIRAVTPAAQSGGTAEPWTRLTMLDAQSATRSRADHLIDYMVQADVYAGSTGGQPEALTHARTVREVLHRMPGLHPDGVVTSVRFTGMIRLPDGDFEPARERVVITAEIIAHPVPV